MNFRLAHTNLNVLNMQRSLAFYQEALGMRVVATRASGRVRQVGPPSPLTATSVPANSCTFTPAASSTKRASRFDSRSRTRRGVKPLLTMRRSLVWFGGSIISIILYGPNPPAYKDLVLQPAHEARLRRQLDGAPSSISAAARWLAEPFEAEQVRRPQRPRGPGKQGRLNHHAYRGHPRHRGKDLRHRPRR